MQFEQVCNCLGQHNLMEDIPQPSYLDVHIYYVACIIQGKAIFISTMIINALHYLGWSNKNMKFTFVSTSQEVFFSFFLNWCFFPLNNLAVLLVVILCVLVGVGRNQRKNICPGLVVTGWVFVVVVVVCVVFLWENSFGLFP